MSLRAIFIILFSINLLNYIDRQILFAVFPLIQLDLNLTDTQLGLLASVFMLVYMLIAPFIGYAADRTPRQIWISLSAFLWSIATMLTALASDFKHLLTARSFIGVGEAGFTSVSPSFLAEKFQKKSRAKVLAFFALALPIGSALGYLLGAWLGHLFGWRQAFIIVGLPGVILAALVFFKIKDTRKTPPREEKPKAKEYLKLLKNKPFLFVCLAQAMGTFTLGGLAAWMPTYFHRYFDMSVSYAGTAFGLITIIAGAIGTLIGGIVADKLFIKTNKAYFLVSAISFCLAFPFGILALLAHNTALALVLFAIAIMFVFLQTGPMQAAIVDTTSLKIRSMAFALNIFIIHALGDAISPAIIGLLSDFINLKTAVFAAMLFIFPAAIFAFIAAKFYKPLSEI
ncbi:MAG: MFS transporter [Elusimicrobiota bacterium]|jgi:predicted MFS family arabinose efflux permease|nr:MFS transporter [Elusimicrobiota bacterium]